MFYSTKTTTQDAALNPIYVQNNNGDVLTIVVAERGQHVDRNYAQFLVSDLDFVIIERRPDEWYTLLPATEFTLEGERTPKHSLDCPAAQIHTPDATGFSLDVQGTFTEALEIAKQITEDNVDNDAKWLTSEEMEAIVGLGFASNDNCDDITAVPGYSLGDLIEESA